MKPDRQDKTRQDVANITDVQVLLPVKPDRQDIAKNAVVPVLPVKPDRQEIIKSQMMLVLLPVKPDRQDIAKTTVVPVLPVKPDILTTTCDARQTRRREDQRCVGTTTCETRQR